MKKNLIITTIIICLVSCTTGKDMIIPEITGQYLVGSTQLVLIDESRNETLVDTNNSAREILIRVWYPAEDISENLLPILSEEEKEAFANAFNVNKNFVKSSRRNNLSNSYIDAPLLYKTDKFPVVIFMHGFSSFEKQNLTMMEELASHGYVVLSLNHPHESIVSLFPDGREVYMIDVNREEMGYYSQTENELQHNIENLKILQSGTSSHDEKIDAVIESYQDFYIDVKKFTDQRYDDLNFVIDKLEEDTNLGIFTGRLKNNNIGLVGHSMGGYIALRAAVDGIDNVTAVISMDIGFSVPTKEDDITLDIPLLSLHSTEDRLPYKKVVDMNGSNSFLLTEDNIDFFQYGVLGTAHNDFSDMVFLPAMKYSGIRGSIASNRISTIVNQTTLAYFNSYLNGNNEQFQNILAGYYPEMVKFQPR